MKPPPFHPDQWQAWLSDAPRELLLLVLAYLLSGDPPSFHPALQSAWEQFLRSPDRRQQKEIREAVADVFRRHFHAPDAEAARLAVELIGSDAESADRAAPACTPLAPAAWQRVQNAVLSVDVLYQRAEAGPMSAWLRQTRVFLREESGAVRSVTQDADLSWEDLPGDVREACVKDNLTRQRFVLYQADAAGA